MKMNKVERKW